MFKIGRSITDRKISGWLPEGLGGKLGMTANGYRVSSEVVECVLKIDCGPGWVAQLVRASS